MHLQNIPIELRIRPQWVSFKYGPEKNSAGRLTKTPVIPGTDRLASVSDPSTWRTFEEAVAGGNPAYVITQEDKLFFLDVDEDAKPELAAQLLEEFPGYAERSQSGKGFHLILSGERSNHKGIHREGVGLFSADRFCIFTGNIIDGRSTISPVDPLQIERLAREMGQGSQFSFQELVELDPTNSDEEVLQVCRAKHPTFDVLHSGNYGSLNRYGSHSEADLAFIGMLAEASPSNAQVKRLFQQSGLYRPAYPHKFSYTIRKCRATEQEAKATDEFLAGILNKQSPSEPLNGHALNGHSSEHPQVNGHPTEEESEVPPERQRNDPAIFDQMPDGLMKEMYEAFMEWAYLPLREGALLAAIAGCVALFSRSHQTFTGRALNMYLFLLGPAGCGKEIISDGPGNLFETATSESTPGSLFDDDSHKSIQGLFGGEFRSAPAIEDALNPAKGGSPRHIGYHGECDAWLANLCDTKNGHWQSCRSRLTEIFTRGNGNFYLRQLKVEKGSSQPSQTKLIRPCLSVLGDCVSQKFYAAIGSSQLDSGFIPRFTVLEVDRSSISTKRSKQKDWSPELKAKIKRLAMQAAKADVENRCQRVEATQEAEDLFDAFSERIRNKMRKGSEDESHGLLHDLRTRCAEKALKLATLAAISRDQENPKVNYQDLDWAIKFVETTDGKLAAKVLGGEHDPAMHKQSMNVRRLLESARFITPKERAATKCFPSEGALLHHPELVPLSWLHNKASTLACFKNKDVQQCLNSVLKGLQASGDVELMSPAEAETKYGVRKGIVVNLQRAVKTKTLGLF